MRVAIDLSFGSSMVQKEHKSLARQIIRCYGANKNHRSPVSLHLTAMAEARRAFPSSLPPDAHLEKWNTELIHLLDPPANELWASDELVWLSPDAEEPLSTPLSPNSVYVIGGLIDRSVDKNQSLQRARDAGAIARRFPIREHAPRADIHKILALPACLEILADVSGGVSWADAFASALPKRQLRRREREEAAREMKKIVSSSLDVGQVPPSSWHVGSTRGHEKFESQQRHRQARGGGEKVDP